MNTQPKRYKSNLEESGKDRQLSSLISIICNNLLLATEMLGSDLKIEAIQELESLSIKARNLSKELISNQDGEAKDDLSDRISQLKKKMLDLVVDLTEELGKLSTDKNSDNKSIEDIIQAKKLLRDSHRGLITIQD